MARARLLARIDALRPQRFHRAKHLIRRAAALGLAVGLCVTHALLSTFLN